MITDNPGGLVAAIYQWYIRHVLGRQVIWIHNEDNKKDECDFFNDKAKHCQSYKEKVSA